MEGGLAYALIGFFLVLILVVLLIEIVQQAQKRRVTRNSPYQNLAECERALNEYSRHLEHDPRDWEMHLKRGEAFVFLGDHQQAIYDYTRALALHQKDASILTRRGRSYAKLLKYDEIGRAHV